jgi:hypothetical protein
MERNRRPSSSPLVLEVTTHKTDVTLTLHKRTLSCQQLFVSPTCAFFFFFLRHDAVHVVFTIPYVPNPKIDSCYSCEKSIARSFRHEYRAIIFISFRKLKCGYITTFTCSTQFNFARIQVCMWCFH